MREDAVVGDAARAHVVLERDRDAEQRQAVARPGARQSPRRGRALGRRATARNAFSGGFSAVNTIERGAADVDAERSPVATRVANRCAFEWGVHQPSTRGTLKRPADGSASGAAASEASRGSDGLTTSSRKRRGIACVRCRLDAFGGDALDLFGVGEDSGQLTREEILLLGRSTRAVRGARRARRRRARMCRTSTGCYHCSQVVFVGAWSVVREFVVRGRAGAGDSSDIQH